ncbi:hypothetical protein [Streptomyces sp. NPDC101149]|uniref:hypothetical protein n=1 Tax=Streptomyces sp. NPDC101149 TaxID=3366113 RepID=UPI003804D311
MSTEAHRASLPPRPTTPPHPPTSPDEAPARPDRTPPAPQEPPRSAWHESTPGSVPPRPEHPPVGHRADAPRVPSAGAVPFPPPPLPEQADRTGNRGRPDAPPGGAGQAPAGGGAVSSAAADGRPSPPAVNPYRHGAEGAPPSASSAADTGSSEAGGAPPRRTAESPRFPNLRLDRGTQPYGPPPPTASSRFPDEPPSAGAAPRGADAQAVPPPRAALPTEGIVETTARLRVRRDETGAAAPRPFVTTLAQPDTSAAGTRRRPVLGSRVHPRVAAAAACLVLGLGLIGGAVTGSWLTGDGSGEGARDAFAVAGSLWHNIPVDQLFPPTVQGPGAGPGGADRTWTRVAVAPDGTCKAAFDPLLRKALAPVGCLRLLRATYTDTTGSHVTTVGLLFTRADATAMAALNSRFRKEGLDRRTDLMPRPYAVKGTVAERFGDAQRASWTISVRTDAPVVVYSVSGFADGRTVTEPQPSAPATATGATTAPAQAGLGFESAGLADRVGAALRKTVTSATEKPS